MKSHGTIKIKAWLPLLGALLILGNMALPTQSAQEEEHRHSLQEEQKTSIKELTIRNSGFRSRSSVIIRYRDEDKKVVEVIENGKSLPVSEFPRYEAVMKKVLELPEIDRLLPVIDRTYRRAESPDTSEEAVFREMMALRNRLRGLDSEVARRYREVTELQAAASMSRMADKISESTDLSPEEKIQQLKELIEKASKLEVPEKERTRQEMFAQVAATRAAQKLIEEIEHSEHMSREEKLREIQELLQKTRTEESIRENIRREGLVEFKAAETLRDMLRDIMERDDLSDLEKEHELQALIEESRKMKLDRGSLMIGVEKFKYDLHLLLKKENLLPEGQAEFILEKNSSTIEGKKLPQAVHERILQMCQETIGRDFESDTKIVLQLNEKR